MFTVLTEDFGRAVGVDAEESVLFQVDGGEIGFDGEETFVEVGVGAGGDGHDGHKICSMD